MSRVVDGSDWTVDEPCCELVIAGQRISVRVRAILADEAFQRHTPAREFVPLTVERGRRTAIRAHFYTPDPELMPANLRRPRLGEGEANFYHEDRILLLWRCNLLERYRATRPAEDRNLQALWDGFEAFLHRRCPTLTLMMVPAWNRAYDQELWRPFIHSRGYTRRSPAGLPGRALLKDVAKASS